MIIVPEIPHDPRIVAGLVPMFLAEVGMADLVNVHANDERLWASVADGTVFIVTRPAAPGSWWTCVANVPGQEPLALLVPDTDHDYHRLAAWIAEQAFTVYDLAA